MQYDIVFHKCRELVRLDKDFKTLDAWSINDFNLISEIQSSTTLKIEYLDNTNIVLYILFKIKNKKVPVVKIFFKNNKDLDIQNEYILSTFKQNQKLLDILEKTLNSFKSQYSQMIDLKEELFEYDFSRTNNVKVWVENSSDLKTNLNFSFIKTHLPNTIYENFDGFFTGVVQDFSFRWKEFLKNTKNNEIIEVLNKETNEFEKLTTLDKIFLLDDFEGDEFKKEVIINMTEQEQEKMFNDLIK